MKPYKLLAAFILLAGCGTATTQQETTITTVAEPDPITQDTIKLEMDSLPANIYKDTLPETITDFRKNYKTDSQALKLKQHILKDSAAAPPADTQPISGKDEISNLMKMKGKR